MADTDGVYYEDYEQEEFYHYYDSARWLEEKKEEEPLDYSVLSVAVMTLGLILFVEVMRHKLDHIAHHRPFFKAVLEATYSELATLGLVELFIFLLLRYYELQNKERKEIFAEVHFALFYTAIFNAFQSALCYYFSTRASSKLWVQTEQLELDHYVEIREEFDRVSEQYHRVSQKARGQWIRNFIYSLKNPGLRSRYLDLLVQVRFHQLRLHFLEGNRLPLTLKVSDYLKRSERKVLIHLVHVSGTAWLMLTGGFNLIYFLEGMIAYKTTSETVVGRSMAAIFFSMLVLFIVVGLALLFKMQSIFQDIIEMKHIQQDNHAERDVAAQRQKNLFWFGEPHLVISLIQFMQFGYASALAIVLMFWTDLGDLAAYWFFGATIFCYAIFVSVLAKILPQYTLCTSLGYLVDKKHLQETVAMHRLHEAQRRQKRKLVQLTFDTDDFIICMAGVSAEERTQSKSNSVSQGSSMEQQLHAMGQSRKSMTSVGDSSSGDSHILATRNEFDIQASIQFDPKDDSTLLAELVKMDTSQLRKQLPPKTQNRLMDRDQRTKDRRNGRKKAVSDGVQAMRAMGRSSKALFAGAANNSAAVEGETKSRPMRAADDADAARKERAERLASRRSSRKKASSASSVIQSWQNAGHDEGPLFNVGNKVSKDDSNIEDMANRQERKKANSASQVIQGWQDGKPMGETGGPKFVLKHNQKTTDDPTELHRQLREERLAERNASRKKAMSASAVIQSWRDFSVPNKPTTSASEEPLNMPSMMDTHNIEQSSATELPEIMEESKPHNASQKITGTIFTASNDPEHPGDPSTVVNLSDARLLPDINEDVPKTKKSVAFSADSGMDDDDDDDDDDSMIYPKNDDDSTVDTGKSVADLSDVASVDIHAFETLRSHSYWEEEWHVKLRRQLTPSSIQKFLREFFLSSNYPVLSHVFGSIVVFFLIGMRVEAMNSATGDYDPSDNTWELGLNYSFWWQVCMYMLFIIMSSLVLWSVHAFDNKPSAERRIVTAAIIDLFLSVLCMTLLFVADAQRCCEDEDSFGMDGYRRLLRFLAGDPSTKDEFTSSIKGYDDDVWTQCCPSVGYRTYGGLGNIEPFTSLIGLRVFRFAAARYIVHRFWSKSGGKKEAGSNSGTEEDPSADEPHIGSDGGHRYGHGSMHSEEGTALELWERAISKYPHIVEKYGQFSGELFQAMLGLEIMEEETLVPTRSIVSVKESVLPAESSHDLKELEDERKIQVDGQANPHYKLNRGQYSSLSAQCQGIILAGKLGKPVKSMSNLMIHSTSGGSLPTLLEEAGVEGEHTSLKQATPDALEFEVDNELLAKEENDDSTFIAPNARLIRSMHRCDRRLYPLLKEWHTVDVVMTEYELVYFEVNEEDESLLDAELRQKKESLLLALQATKGGKGLRLADVAAGRKVVGHLDLADVTQVHVQRELPLLDVSDLEENEHPFDIDHEPPSEYWLKPSHVEVHTHSRTLRWAKVREDRLTIHSIHGTLFLRFYSDLNDTESDLDAAQHEDELIGELKKDIAFQWAQTVAHICGNDQLKQALPHFGTNDSKELRDYLEVHHHKTDEARTHRRQRSATVGGPHILANSEHFTSATDARTGSIQHPKPTLRHSKSLGEANTGSSFRNVSRKIFGRSSSSGDHDAKASEHQNASIDDDVDKKELSLL